jgi:N-acetyl-anhydromuramyl-L-alanine amidase AmpD
MKLYRGATRLKRSTIPKDTKKRRLDLVNSVVIHTTGYGVGLQRIVKHQKEKEDSLKIIGEIYAHRMATILKYKGHFLIDHTGEIWQFFDVGEIAWHSGSKQRTNLKKNKPFKWWSNRWGGVVKKPTDLPSWDHSPNINSIGIDLLAHGNGEITEAYTEEQYKSLARLVYCLCEDYSIPYEREHILGHEDIDPISRGTEKGGWDPSPFDWDKMFDMVQSEIDSRNRGIPHKKKAAHFVAPRYPSFFSMLKRIFKF